MSLGLGSGQSISSAELRVLLALVSGLTTKEIAATCGVSASTVRFHLTNLKARLGARSLAQLGALAATRGLIPAPSNAVDGQLWPTGLLTGGGSQQ